MSWSKKYKRSIDCDNPSGFSQKAHCAARKKRARGEKTKSSSPFNEMHEVKSHKSVEQIAKKHRLEVSFVKKQLEMGIPIEHEHTKDKDLATDIALQHLDEIPDYYTRLKKMESDAKSEHKKFKDVKEGTLHHWFKGSKSKDGKPGWVQSDGSPCANEPGETKTPKCFSSARLKALKSKGEKGEALIRSAVRRKRQKDKSQQEKSGASSPTNVATFAKGKKDPNYVKAEPGIKEQMEISEAQKDKPSKGSGKKDACYHKVKSRYSVWPSAYASGALVKCRKVGAANWGTKSENTDYSDGDDLDNKDRVNVATHEKHVKYEKRYCAKCKKEEHRHECKHGPATWEAYSIPINLKDMHTSHLHLEATSQEEKRYCPLCDKRETRSECSYGEKAWDKVSVKDHEYSMARSELKTIIDAAKRIQSKVGKGEGNIEAWVQSKITKAADYIDTAADYIASGEMEESLGYTINPSSHKKAQKREKIRNIAVRGSTEGEKSAASGKLGSTAELPKIKEEKLVDKILDEMKCWPGYKKKGTQTLFGKKYNRCVKKENVTIEDADGKTFVEVIDLIKPDAISSQENHLHKQEICPYCGCDPCECEEINYKFEESVRLPSVSGNVIEIMLSWRGRVYISKMFFPQAKVPNRREVTDEIVKVYPDAKVLSFKVSDLTPGQPIIQVGYHGGNAAAIGPNKRYVKPIGEQLELDEDWQSVNRKDKTDGLSQAAVNAYRRENPGSKLQTAVTEKKPTGKRAKRRSSFCRRMKGMKSKLTSAKTARDPDSRINKALRRWNCN